METWEESAFPNGRDSEDSSVQLLVWHVSNRAREGPCHPLLNSEGLGSQQLSAAKGTQCRWFPGPSLQKLEKQNFMDNTREEMSFIMEQSTGKGSTGAHTEEEGTRRGLPLCLGVNKALLVEAWGGELWGPVHEASILPSNPVFGVGLQGRPHSQWGTWPCMASRQLCSVGCCIKSEQEPDPKCLWHLWPLARQNYS